MSEDIRSKLGGKWVLDRSENFEAALEEMGLNVVFRKLANHSKPNTEILLVDDDAVKIGLNVVFRKLASHSKPSMEILVDEDAVKIIVKASFFTQTMVLPLNQAYVEEFDGIKMNCTTKWADDKLITEASPIEPSKHKPQKFQRERINDELIQTMWIGNVVCTRVFKQST